MKRITLLSSAALVTVLSFTACSEPQRAISAPASSTAEQLAPAQCGSIAQLHSFGSVLLASQPESADFALLQQRGVKTVINLRRPTELKDFDEKQVVESAGMVYVNLPIGGPTDLNDALFDALRAELKTAARPILVHCASANRVGAVWLPYRVLDGGLSYEAALAEAKTVGLSNGALEAKAREYIERHR